MKDGRDGYGYSAIGDYALIGDSRAAALVSRDGSIDWLCLPYFSSRAIFAALLDAGRGGRFRIRPTQPFKVEREYQGESAVLVTRFTTAEGVVQLTDLMPVVTAYDDGSLLPERELLRIVDGLEGRVELEAIYMPRPNYARAHAPIKSRGALGWTCEFHDEITTLLADPNMSPDGEICLRAKFTVEAGDHQCFSLSYARKECAVILPTSEARARCAATLRWWRDWSAGCTYLGPYRDHVMRSAITLKLLTYSLSGAVVAAPTASLPECVGGARNWDYRFCWLRDASLTLRAFIDIGYRDEAEAFLGWLLHATRLTWPRLQVLYDVYGETRLPEWTLHHMAGYRGSRPVRIGNAAGGQFQLDIYGQVILSAHDYVSRGGRLGVAETRMLAGFARSVSKLWRQPDNGIWEARTQPEQHTFSKLMCWVALDRLINLHEGGHLRLPVERLRRERRAVEELIEQQGFNRDLNSYVTHFGSDEVDASLLLLSRVGYIDANHPRMRGTFDRIDKELGIGPFVKRYRDGQDGLPGGEGAFGIAGFWAVDYLVLTGDLAQAHRRFEALLAGANDLRLFAEENDPHTCEALGNFPQAFTHVGLISAALALDAAQKTSQCPS